MESVRKKHRQQQAVAYKQRAVEPEAKYCFIQHNSVTVLVDYPEYVNMRNKGPRGDVYCENIVDCFRNNVQCRYSGISPLYRDPFTPINDGEVAEENERTAKKNASISQLSLSSF